MKCAFSDLLALAREEKIELATDSRNAVPGGLFFVVQGENDSGLRYVDDAVTHHIKYIVCERDGEELEKRYPEISVTEVRDVREAVAHLAAERYHADKRGLRILGITGTNGKTTCAALLEAYFLSQGYKAGNLGTITYRWNGHTEKAPLTTPDAITLQRMLWEMEKEGTDFCVMEVSSHAVQQKRIAYIPFAGCAFTNLTQDHLDYHRDMESYFAAKKELFTTYKPPVAAINGDDFYGMRLIREISQEVIPYSFQNMYEHGLKGEILRSDTQGLHLGMSYEGKTWEIVSPLIGAFNGVNLLTVQALLLGLGFAPESFSALASFSGVCGRLERVCDNVFVDYAHTPDALKNILLALRAANFQRIICVFGCGGNRDRTKRKIMGEVVAELADVAVLTSDNPRFEDPMAIIEDVKQGLSGAKECLIEENRKKATHMALDLLRKPTDCVVIAGKGHEDYQIIQGVRHHYSDQEVVKEYFACKYAARQ